MSMSTVHRLTMEAKSAARRTVTKSMVRPILPLPHRGSVPQPRVGASRLPWGTWAAHLPYPTGVA